jgi:Uma2 family endonuclease
LQSGDRLSRDEFERRYAASPVQNAELIERVVYVASPLRFQQHAAPHSRLHGWVWTYQVATPGLRLGIEPTVRLDADNEVQPDIALMRSVGGQTRIDADGYIEGAPELVIEIAASSAAIDLGDKKQVYQRSGVQDYLVWQVFENRLDWFQLTNGKYQPLQPNPDGILLSISFPGLWLAIAPLLSGEMSEVLSVLQQGLASPAH